MTRPLTMRDWLVAGFGAGIVSGVTVSAFAIFAATRAGLATTEPFAFIASVFGGPLFEQHAAAVPIGVATLFATTIFWSFGYIYGAQKLSQLLTRPIISGVGFGVIVWFIMQGVLIEGGRYTAPTIYSFDRDMVAFIVFFGVPLAFTAARLLRSR